MSPFLSQAYASARAEQLRPTTALPRTHWRVRRKRGAGTPRPRASVLPARLLFARSIVGRTR